MHLNISRLNNHLFQAISHILNVSYKLRESLSEAQEPLFDDRAIGTIGGPGDPRQKRPDFDVFDYLTEDESAELVNVESLRQAIYHQARIVERIKARIIQQAEQRRAGHAE